MLIYIYIYSINLYIASIYLIINIITNMVITDEKIYFNVKNFINRFLNF